MFLKCKLDRGRNFLICYEVLLEWDVNFVFRCDLDCLDIFCVVGVFIGIVRGSYVVVLCCDFSIIILIKYW